MLGLGLLLAGRGGAQPLQVAPRAVRLSSHPYARTGAAWPRQAGDLAPDSLPGSSLYVPPNCVGPRRCPLVVVASDLQKTLQGWLRPVADRYGLIVLGLDPYLPVRIDAASMHTQSSGEAVRLDPQRLAAALTQMSRRLAVDPDRIALIAYVSGSAPEPPPVVRDAWPAAVANLAAFSRIVLSGALTEQLPLPPPVASAAPRRPARGLPRFLLAADVPYAGTVPAAVRFAAALRQQGYSAALQLHLQHGGHGMWEELDAIGRWLDDSWARPNATPSPATGDATAGALPLLTTEAVGRLARFWVSFQQEPDSIWRLGRRAHLRDVTLPFGTDGARPTIRLTDMAALARQYPSVAAKLTAAGLTAAEHDTYRLALISARVVQAFGAGGVDTVLLQNAAFLKAHQPKPQNNWLTGLFPGAVLAGHSQYEGDSVLNPEGLHPAENHWQLSGMWETP